MRTITFASILLFVACTTEPAFEYVPAKPVLSEGAVCDNFPLGIKGPGWFNQAGVELASIGILALGNGPGLHSLCGTEESDRLFKVEQVLIFDDEYEKQTMKTRYHVCTGTISRSDKRHHPDATVTITLKGHKVCDEISGTYGHKKPKSAEKKPTTPCERYSACVCTLSAAKLDAKPLAELCQETKGLLTSAKRDDGSCNMGLKLMQESATKLYGIPIPEICK